MAPSGASLQEGGGLLRVNQGVPSQAQGEAEAALGDPLSSQGTPSPDEPPGRALVKAKGGPASLGPRAAEALPISPKDQKSLRQQEELETTCAKLQRQVGEMEVREAVARAVCP